MHPSTRDLVFLFYVQYCSALQYQPQDYHLLRRSFFLLFFARTLVKNITDQFVQPYVLFPGSITLIYE